MNVDEILRQLNNENVEFLLIGGMNFLLRHVPELTFDVDIWVKDDLENLACLNRSLSHLGAEWGRVEKEWRPVPLDAGWLLSQAVFCLTTRHGALDIFREVKGLEGRYAECRARAIASRTGAGVPFCALSDEDMLACQLALPPGYQRHRRIEVLRKAIERSKS